MTEASKNNKSTTTKRTTTKKTTMTPYEKEQLETLKKINEFKEACEANVVCIIYKNPDLLRENPIELKEFTNNVWRVYFEIAKEIILVEKKNALDDITIGLYLSKHKKLEAKYEEYGAYDMISNSGAYIKEENFDGYLNELHKWNAVIKLAGKGFGVVDRLKEFCDMTAEDIYKEFEGYLNHIFANADSEVKSYNALSGLHELVDKLNKGEDTGMPITAELLNKEIGGLRLGNIYSLTGGSGAGKSTIILNYLLPKVMELNQRVGIFINEEDVTKVRKELLLYCATNILHTPIKKIQLRDGNFDKETLETLHKAANWLEEQDRNHNITVVPLEKYTVGTVVKLIKKYKSLFDIDYYVLDTFKESSDSNEEAYRSMLKDSVVLYDLVKPAKLNVCLVVTMQTSKSSLKTRHLTNQDIGQAKSVVDVYSCSILVRRAEPDEYKSGKKELKCFRTEGKSKIPFFLEENNYYFLFFIGKNRFGVTDQYAIVTKADLSTNSFKDIGYCIVPEDY